MNETMFGLPIALTTMESVVRRSDDAIRTRDQFLIGVVNAAKIVKARSDHELRQSLLDCDAIVADGQSVVWAGQVLGHRIPERITGIDLFARLLERADIEGHRIYLLGASPEVLSLLLTVIDQRFDNLTVAGSHHGYFADEEADRVVADISRSRSDMLFIGMPSPYKERFLAQYGHALGVPVLHGVGGSFDVLAGVTKRAPALWQRTGLEWAYRLLQEPRRLWRRYLVTNTAFLILLAKERIVPTPPYRTDSSVRTHAEFRR